MVGPDTKRGWMPEKVCSDCGCVGCSWGSRSPEIVPKADPEGSFMNFCVFCYDRRQKRATDGLAPLPLGIKPPGVPKEFSGREITVVTKNGSEYHFGPPGDDGVRSVSCETRDIGFDKCEILLVEEGEPLWFKGTDIDQERVTLAISSVTLVY